MGLRLELRQGAQCGQNRRSSLNQKASANLTKNHEIAAQMGVPDGTPGD